MWHAKSIYQIPVSFYASHGIETIVFDLDNTLDPPFCKVASDRARKLIVQLRESGLRVVIVSNNTKKRIERYLGDIKVDGYVFDAKKPKADRLVGLLDSLGADRSKTVLIGDQMFTDKKASQNCQIQFILTERLSWKELPWTYCNRFKELFVRKKMLKKGLLGKAIEEEKEA